jgi:hypothetical protein
MTRKYKANALLTDSLKEIKSETKRACLVTFLYSNSLLIGDIFSHATCRLNMLFHNFHLNTLLIHTNLMN